MIDPNPGRGGVGLFFTDFSGAVLDANDAFLAMTGYSTEDVRAGLLNWRRMTPPEDHPENDAAVETLRLTGIVHGEKEFVGKHGTRIPVAISCVLADHDRDRGRGFAAVVDLRSRPDGETYLRAEVHELEASLRAARERIDELERECETLAARLRTAPASYTVRCKTCRATLMTVPRIGDEQAEAMRRHLAAHHPEIRGAARASLVPLLAKYDVEPR